MPRPAKKAAWLRQGWTADHLEQVLTGRWFFRGLRLDDAQLQQCWEAYRAPLLALHMATYPATRPWSWWSFEAPARRERTDGQRHPFDDGSMPPPVQRLSWGMPALLQTPDHFAATYECQCTYLARLGLLTADERRLMRAPAWHCAEEAAGTLGSPKVSRAAIEQWQGHRNGH